MATNVKVTPRKVRLVLDLIRGKSVEEAIAILTNLNKAASLPVLKVVKSAAANATNNHNLDGDRLFIKEIYANDGLRMKRFMPRAKGSASGIVKRSSHVICVVAER
ncbi:MAG: 50S ribosomal protein L22 [Bacilli bacterium]